jgi:hypothetical protein
MQHQVLFVDRIRIRLLCGDDDFKISTKIFVLICNLKFDLLSSIEKREVMVIRTKV